MIGPLLLGAGLLALWAARRSSPAVVSSVKTKSLAPIQIESGDLENRFGVLTIKPSVWANRIGAALADRDVVLTSSPANDPAQALLVKRGDGTQNALIWAQTQAMNGRAILINLDSSPAILLALSSNQVAQWAPAYLDKERQVWIGARAVLWAPMPSASSAAV